MDVAAMRRFPQPGFEEARERFRASRRIKETDDALDGGAATGDSV
jgi:hypothetical protein